MVKGTRKKNIPPPPAPLPDTILLEMDLGTANKLYALLNNGINFMLYQRHFSEVAEELLKAGATVDLRLRFKDIAKLA